MIFGKTYSQIDEDMQIRLKKEAEWTKKFAYLPTRMGNGQFVWLDYYWFKYDHYLDYHRISWRKSTHKSKQYDCPN